MTRLFFLIVLVVAIGLIFHVVMSRVQEEEDEEGEDQLFQTEEGTISLSPRVQRDMGDNELDDIEPPVAHDSESPESESKKPLG